MSRIKSSTIKPAQFLESLPSISGTISYSNGRKRWIVGALTSNTLFRLTKNEQRSNERGIEVG
jgi:hypothetical protein